MYSKKLWHPQDTTRNRDFTGQAKYYTRTEFPVQYFYIDFGLSRKYNLDDGPPRELPILGGDKSVPEYKDPSMPKDPYKIDVYCLGNLIRRDLMGVSLEYG